MLKKQLLILTAILVASGLSGLEGKEISTSLDERVAMKKLSHYWEEKDYAQVKIAIVDFLNKYPYSQHIDQLHMLLGDLYFSEKNYTKAIACYTSIDSREYQQKSAFHKLHSLYETEQFQEFIAPAQAFLKAPYAKRSEIETITFELAETYQALGQQSFGEAKKECFKQAISYYEELKRTGFEISTLDSLAHLYAAIEDYPQAANAYLKAAEKDKKKREELLFHAASFQVHYDKKAAIQTFDRIFKMKGALAEKSGYNMIVLLFQMQRYSDVLLSANYVEKNLPENKLGPIQYYIGKSLFYEKDFQKAADILEEALQHSENADLKESIVLTLITCAKETNDLSLCDRMIKQLSSSEHLQAALLIHAQLCRHHKEWTVAREDIEKLLLDYPEHVEKESLVYDLALLLMQEGKNEESADLFDTFVKDYPSSPYKAEALQNSLSLRLAHVEKTTAEEKRLAQEKLLPVLKSVLDETTLLKGEEHKSMHLFLAQTALQVGQKAVAAEELKDYVETYAQDPSCASAYVLLALCYQESSDRDYIQYAECALRMNPQIPQASQLRKSLFNRYLNLCQSTSTTEKKEYMEKAAEHLFLVADAHITQENQRWLAGYYLKNSVEPERAILVLEKLIKNCGESPLLSPHVEAEALRLSLLYRQENRHRESISLLELLTQEQKKVPELEWKYSRMTQFELGKSYSLAGNLEKAIEIYQNLISSASHLSSYFGDSAQVELSKMVFNRHSTIPLENALQTCDQLKEIELKRQLCSEPLHIEAGLQYASIKAKLVDEPFQAEKKALLLNQVKTGITTFYSSEMSLIPEKEELIKQYLSYIEIELSQLKENSVQKTKEQLSELLTSVSNETLKERIIGKLKELDRDL